MTIFRSLEFTQTPATIQGAFFQGKLLDLSKNRELCDTLTCPNPIPPAQLHNSLEIKSHNQVKTSKLTATGERSLEIKQLVSGCG